MAMLWPLASPVRNSNRMNSRFAVICGCIPINSAKRLVCPTTAASSANSVCSWRAVLFATAASGAISRIDLVIFSSIRVVTMPFSVRRDSLAPRPTDGHTGDS